MYFGKLDSACLQTINRMQPLQPRQPISRRQQCACDVVIASQVVTAPASALSPTVTTTVNIAAAESVTATETVAAGHYHYQYHCDRHCHCHHHCHCHCGSAPATTTATTTNEIQTELGEPHGLEVASFGPHPTSPLPLSLPTSRDLLPHSLATSMTLERARQIHGPNRTASGTSVTLRRSPSSFMPYGSSPLQRAVGVCPGPSGSRAAQHGGGGGSAGVAPAMVWVGAWLGPTLPTVVPPFGCGGRKPSQVFRWRKPVVFGCRAIWVIDVAPVSVHAREV